MEKVLFKTKFDKEIVEGQQYYAVINTGEIKELKADISQASDKSIVEKFLTITGANKASKKILAKLAKAPQKTEEELEAEQLKAEEDRLKAMPILEQLDEVESKEDWDKWLNRNKLKTDSESNGNLRTIGIKSEKGAWLISLIFNIYGVSACCGGREIGSHNGLIDSNHSRYITTERMEVLATHLVYLFNEILTKNGKYGYISYVRDARKINSAYGRMSFIFEASNLFNKTGTFNNPNGGNSLDIYTINDNW